MGSLGVSGNTQVQLRGQHRAISAGVFQRDGIPWKWVYARAVSRRHRNARAGHAFADFPSEQHGKFCHELRRLVAMGWEASVAGPFPAKTRQAEYHSRVQV